MHPPTPVTAVTAPTRDEADALRRVVKGTDPGDVAIRGGQLVHVHGAPTRPADVIVHGRHIAAVVPRGARPATRDVDATGLYIAPTFLDAHFHPAFARFEPGETARVLVPKGTTTLLADPDSIAGAGAPGRADADVAWALRVFAHAADVADAATLEDVAARLRVGRLVTVEAGPLGDAFRAILGEPGLIGLAGAHLAFGGADRYSEDPDDIRGIDHHVREAVELGVPAEVAIRMGSYNAASHYGLDHLVGSITASRLADLQLLADLETFAPVSVWVGGVEVAREGVAVKRR